MPDARDKDDSFIPGIKKNVLALGLVSFFTDISSEMIYPLVPIFLTSVLGAPMGTVGVIEGIAEGSSSFLRGPAGWFSWGAGSSFGWRPSTATWTRRWVTWPLRARRLVPPGR